MVVWIFLVLAAVLVFVVAAVTVGREAFRLGHQPPPTIVDVDEAVHFVADDLPDEAQGRLTYDEVRTLVAAQLDLMRTRGVLAPPGEELTVRTNGEAEPPVVIADDDAVATLERVRRNLTRYRASVLKAAVEGRLVPTEAKLARAEGRSYEPASVLLERILAERRRRWEEAELAKMKAKGKVPKDDKWKAKYVEPIAPDTSELPDLPEGWCWATWGTAPIPGWRRPCGGLCGRTTGSCDPTRCGRAGGWVVTTCWPARDWTWRPIPIRSCGPKRLSEMA